MNLSTEAARRSLAESESMTTERGLLITTPSEAHDVVLSLTRFSETPDLEINELVTLGHEETWRPWLALVSFTARPQRRLHGFTREGCTSRVFGVTLAVPELQTDCVSDDRL
ncbi:hypothetical protein MTO96_013331 [Rhipicephalus appendiculatus]